MEAEFLGNNLHLDSEVNFEVSDPHLKRMNAEKYIFESSIVQELPQETPGIYNLGGGRQVGKSTLLKQWMLKLLKNGTNPESIAFFSCELIRDEISLYRILNNQLNEMPQKGLRYLILDEITYVSDWDKAIKYLADLGMFENTVVVMSGSDLVMMQDARKRFPGRRGTAETVDFHYFPLSFRESVFLKNRRLATTLSQSTENVEDTALLYDEFEQYLCHGGFLSAINQYGTFRTINNQTLATYSDWIRGDVAKRDKNEHYLREILGSIVKHYSTQISWRHLVSSLSIDHTQTAVEYASLLVSMDAVYIQAALIEDKLTGAPKKLRKFLFCDPFIYHAVNSWLKPSRDPFHSQIQKAINEEKTCSQLVEAVVTSHFRRYYPTYYIKAEQEVDVAYINKNKFWPIEIKWTRQIRPQDLKQILKYKNGQVWAKVNKPTTFSGLTIQPLPKALFDLKPE